MLDSIQFKLYANSKPGVDPGYIRTSSLISAKDKSLTNKQVEDEEFYRIMELIKTEKNDEYEYPSQREEDQDSNEIEDISCFMLFIVVFTLLMTKVIQGFQNIIMKVKELFDQCFPYIWTWMKSITRGTYTVSDGKVGLFILCVPLLTLVLFLYCSLLTFNAVTELLLSSAPVYLTQMIVTDKFSRLFSRQRILL